MGGEGEFVLLVMVATNETRYFPLRRQCTGSNQNRSVCRHPGNITKVLLQEVSQVFYNLFYRPGSIPRMLCGSIDHYLVGLPNINLFSTTFLHPTAVIINLSPQVPQQAMFAGFPSSCTGALNPSQWLGILDSYFS